jgi:hypothetical protein
LGDAMTREELIEAIVEVMQRSKHPLTGGHFSFPPPMKTRAGQWTRRKRLRVVSGAMTGKDPSITKSMAFASEIARRKRANK